MTWRKPHCPTVLSLFDFGDSYILVDENNVDVVTLDKLLEAVLDVGHGGI